MLSVGSRKREWSFGGDWRPRGRFTGGMPRPDTSYPDSGRRSNELFACADDCRVGSGCTSQLPVQHLARKHCAPVMFCLP
jgi:hypothetical protein